MKHIILLEAGGADRRDLENISDETFQNIDDVRKLFTDELIILSLDDFITDVNDQVLDNLTGYFITYVNIINK